MPGPAGELIVTAKFDPRRWWILIPLRVAGRSEELNMVLDTGSPFSALHEAIQRELLMANLLDEIRPNSYRLHGLSIQDQEVPDLVVRVSARVTAVGAEGLLGLDFLGQFTDIHFNLPSMRLTLVDP